MESEGRAASPRAIEDVEERLFGDLARNGPKLAAGLEHVATYQPTFLYEALWNLALIGVLLWVERRWSLRPGRLFAASSVMA